MLKLIYGRSGSGKTHWILERMAELIRQGQERLFWLVPEQHSFACERALLHRLGAVQAVKVQVLSFSRLADRVFREVGGLAGQPLDEGVRALLMSRALEQVAQVAADQGDPMEGLRPRLVTDSAYVEKLLSLWEELRRCAVTTPDLERVATKLAESETESSLLIAKTEDLCRVFTTYEGLVKDTGLREADDLTRLADVLPSCALLQGAAVFVDGFKGFTQQELAILEKIIPQAEELSVALCTDTLGQAWHGAKCRREDPLFAPVTSTVNRLKELAGEQKWEPVALEENHRTASPALKALEAGLYAPVPDLYEEKTEDVVVTPCASVYEECRYAVRQIRRLLREGYRCREIAVAVRQLGDYQGILDDMLTQEGVSYYMDARRDLLCEPLVVYVRAALRLAVHGWRTEELLRLMKTDLWELDPVAIAEMENYVYTWQIDGARWNEEWTEHPSGLDAKEGLKPADRQLLDRLNQHRRSLIDSLSPLQRALRGGATGREFSLAVYTWLSSQKGLPQRIADQVQLLTQMAQPLLADHAARLWDEMMKLLDRFVVALDNQHLSATRWEELFTMLCRTLDLGTIPQGLDAVQVGSVDRMRFNAPRVVLVLGANEGVLPAYPLGDGLLTEEERRRLKAQGLNLAEDVLTQCIEERYYAYLALTAPSERLIVTYRSEDTSGPSSVVTAIRKIVKHHKADVAADPTGWDLESAHEMFRRLAQSQSVATEEAAHLHETLSDVVACTPEQARRLKAVKHLKDNGMKYKIQDADVAAALFRKDMTLSATKADTFYKCPFQYYCKYGLGLKERRVAKIDGGVFGELVHHAMEVLIPAYCHDGLVEVCINGVKKNLRKEKTAADKPDPELKKALAADVEPLLDTYVEDKLGGIKNKDGSFRYLLNLAKRSAVNMLWHTLVEFQQSAFNPVAYELPILPVPKTKPDEEENNGDKKKEKKTGVRSLEFSLEKGSMQFSGKIDRVDVYEAKDAVYVRVVDYKTGNIEFKLHELTEGLGLQMLLYLFTLCHHYRYQKGKKELPVTAAGVLYHPLSDLVADRGEKSKRLESMKMDGVVLAEEEIIGAMEKEKAGVFIPAKMGKGGPDKNVATPDQFAMLERLIQELLVKMGNRLLSGDIEALPIKNGQHAHCTYCDFKALCGHEAEDPIKELDTPEEDKYKSFAFRINRLDQVKKEEWEKEAKTDE